MMESDGTKQPQVDSSLKGVECPYCRGTMLKSRKTMLQGIHIYWQKPWGPALKMDEAVVPLACVNCGGVMLALRDASRVSREWNELPDEEKEIVLKDD